LIGRIRKFDRSVPTNMIQKNLISFRKFQEDYKVSPLLIEALLVYDMGNETYYCMTVDLLAEVTYEKKWKEEVQVGEFVRGDKKGQPKYENQERSEVVTETVCIDFKSNPFDKEDKSFFDSHKYQLIAAKKAVMQNFDINPVRLMNWSPKSWKGESKLGAYTLHEWKVTNNDYEVFSIYEQLSSRLGHFIPSGMVEDINLNKERASEMYRTFSYTEYVESLSNEE